MKVVVLVIAISLLIPSCANACQCGIREVGDSYQEASLVAVVTVMKIDDVRSLWNRFRDYLGIASDFEGGLEEWEITNGYKVFFRVDRSWKNVSPPSTSLFTGRGGGDCGFSFEPGASYLVYAVANKEGTLTTNICFRTRPIDQAEEDILFLDKLVQKR